MVLGFGGSWEIICPEGGRSGWEDTASPLIQSHLIAYTAGQGYLGLGYAWQRRGGGGKGRGFGVVKKYSHMGSDTCIHLAMSCKFDKCICSMSMIRTQSENLSCITLILH